MPYIGTGCISVFLEAVGSGGIPVFLLHELGGPRRRGDHARNWRFGGGLVNFGYMVRAEDIACVLGSLQIRQYDPLGNLQKVGE